MQQESDNLLFCPSFSSYTSDRVAEIAAKVTLEVTEAPPPVQASHGLDDDFEFSLVLDALEAPADEIFNDGQIRPIFPIFNRDLLIHGDQGHENKPGGDVSTLRIPLKDLFMEDREVPSSSSSEADELDSLPSGTYCVWRPKDESVPGKCKKSNSTGSASKRWKFLDLLRRSNSDGKESFAFLSPKNRDEKGETGERVENSKERRNSIDGSKLTGKVKARGFATGEKASSSAHEVFYVRNRAMKEGDKRKSYLPYKQDLLGFFANPNGFGKTTPF